METTPVFWLRGLIPAQWAVVEPPVHTEQVHLVGKHDHLQREGLYQLHGQVLYVDESGGPRSSDPHLRRTGWGIALLGKGCEFVAGWFAAVPGQPQTQIRAGLSAIRYILAATSGDVEVVPDCKAIVDGWEDLEQGKQKRLCANADLWDEIKQLAARRQGTLALRRVNSHLTWRQAQHFGMTMHDWIGNKVADKLADLGAAKGAVPADDLRRLDALQAKVQLIHRRMLAVHGAALAKLGPNERHLEREPLTSAARRHLQASGHRIQWHSAGRFATCMRCGQCTSSRRFRTWIRTTLCQPLEEHGDFAMSGQGQVAPIVIGNATIHQSHRVAYYRGVWFCPVCGAYTMAVGNSSGRTLVRRLGRVCSGHCDRSSAARLRRIYKGLPPRSGNVWPRKPSTTTDYQPGEQVLVLGLRKATQYNGCYGTVQGFDCATGRWQLLMRQGDAIRVQPKCVAAHHTDGEI